MVVLICSEIYFVVVGVVCLIWPYEIQVFSLSHGGPVFYNPFKSWVRTQYYIWSLRSIGILSIACGAVVANFILRYFFAD